MDNARFHKSERIKELTGGNMIINSQTGVVNSGNLDASGNRQGSKVTVIPSNIIITGKIVTA